MHGKESIIVSFASVTTKFKVFIPVLITGDSEILKEIVALVKEGKLKLLLLKLKDSELSIRIVNNSSRMAIQNRGGYSFKYISDLFSTLIITERRKGNLETQEFKNWKGFINKTKMTDRVFEMNISESSLVYVITFLVNLELERLFLSDSFRKFFQV